jgi:hypothetical protein
MALLQVRIADQSGNPLPGQGVTFTSSYSGPGALFGDSLTATATTDASGVATAPLARANLTPGPYTVTAASGTLSAVFSLTNMAPAGPPMVVPNAEQLVFKPSTWIRNRARPACPFRVPRRG